MADQMDPVTALAEVLGDFMGDSKVDAPEISKRLTKRGFTLTPIQPEGPDGLNVAEHEGVSDEQLRTPQPVQQELRERWNRLCPVPEHAATDVAEYGVLQKTPTVVNVAYRNGWQDAKRYLIEEIQADLAAQGLRVVPAKQEPDWFYCTIDPDECGDSAYEAMHGCRPRLEPVELHSSYHGPHLWDVMSPPLPDADNDEETAHTFDTEEEARIFCQKRRAIFDATPTTEPGSK